MATPELAAVRSSGTELVYCFSASTSGPATSRRSSSTAAGETVARASEPLAMRVAAARLGGAESGRLVEGGASRAMQARRRGDARQAQRSTRSASRGRCTRRCSSTRGEQGDPPGAALVRRAHHRAVPRDHRAGSARRRCAPGSRTRRSRASRCPRSSGCATTSRRRSRRLAKVLLPKDYIRLQLSRRRWRPSHPTRRAR